MVILGDSPFFSPPLLDFENIQLHYFQIPLFFLEVWGFKHILKTDIGY